MDSLEAFCSGLKFEKWVSRCKDIRMGERLEVGTRTLISIPVTNA